MVWAHDGGTSGDGCLHAGFHRSITLGAYPGKIDLHLFAYTRYLLYLNGRYFGRGPGRFENRSPEYDTWDLSGALNPGENTIDVLVHRDAPNGRMMRHAPGFAALLFLHDQAGGVRVIRTDADWLAGREDSFEAQPEVWSSIPETIDSRKAAGPWFQPNRRKETARPAVAIDTRDREAWPDLAPRSMPLLRETDVPLAVAVDKIGAMRDLPADLAEGTELTWDAGRIVQAFHVLELEAQAGVRIEVTPLLPDGVVMPSSVYVTSQGIQTWIGGDVWTTRFLRLRVANGGLRLRQVRLIERLYPFEIKGSFHSSDPSMDRLWQIGVRSLQLLSEDAYVDCADRERAEWMDNDPPAFAVTRVAMAGPPPSPGLAPAWSDSRLLRALLRRLALTQMPDGMLKAHTCSERWDLHAIMEDRSCGWIEGLRRYYETSGDRAFVQAHWPVCQRLLDWFLVRRTASGLVSAREWATWDNPLAYATGEGAVLNAFVAHAFSEAAWLAEQIGDATNASACRATAAELGDAFNRELWIEALGAYASAHGRPEILPKDNLIRQQLEVAPYDAQRLQPTLQANLFALNRGVVPAERRPRVIAWVLAHPHGTKQIMSQQFLSELLYQLDDASQDEAVLQRLRQWQPMIESPWQTTWEMFDPKWGSKIHAYGMMPVTLLSSWVLGVRRVEPLSARALLIEPRLGELTHAGGVVVTEFGPVSVEWRKAGSAAMDFTVELPAHVTALVRLPGTPASDVKIGRQVIPFKSVGRWCEFRLSTEHAIGTVRHDA
jgi:hypothetical protein